MVGASKILTVSYGTFSCTLEGFDDPFDTMKAIAEYFRDLAAQDRYFGAEPPQPDAAMLHRLAERELHRRVDAKVQDNGVILRASPAPAVATHAVAGPALAAAAGVVPVGHAATARISEQIDDLGEDMPAPVTVAAGLPRLSDASDSLSGSVAEKLRRLRAGTQPTVAPPKNAPRESAELTGAPIAKDASVALAAEDPATSLAAPVAAAAPAGDMAAEPLPAPDAPAADLAPEAVADDPASTLHAAVALEGPDAATPEVEPGEDMAADAAPGSDMPSPVEPVTGPDTAEADAEADGVPMDTARLRPDEASFADDKASAIAAAFAADFGADEDEDMAGATPETRLAANLPAAETPLQTATEIAEDAPVADAPAAHDLTARDHDDNAAPSSRSTDLPAEATASDEDDALIADLAADLPAENATPEPAEATASDEDDALIADLAADLPAEKATPEPAEATASDEDDALIAALAAGLPAEKATPEPAEATASDEDDALIAALAADLPAEKATPEPATPPSTPIDAHTDQAQADAIAPPPTAEPAPAPVTDRIQRARARVIKIRRIEPAPSILSPEAEAELARELEDLRGRAVDHVTAPLPATQRRDAHAGLPDAPEDTSVKRLLDAANSQMEEPESRRRLSAIAHLKAAVAATFADREAGNSPMPQADETRLTAYRSDLEQVVRPRRPVSGTSSAPPPAPPARPAPLVLVSAQRIDRPHPPAGPVQPVRPRRVAALTLAPEPAERIPGPDQTGGTARMAALIAHDGDDEADDDTGNIFANTADFADFAERMGAQALPDLLETAAVYAALVEGRDSVTRPQLIRRVIAAKGGDELTREDMLRSFGRLLRDGRIEKVRRGQFGLREGSRALAEGRRLLE
ncbi:MAG: hypothetical protein ACK4GO_14280 [Gemmobacter sp.]